ncbi:hypothetical protein COHA_003127 [Chlorella ohadii]|uniref:Apple domain-containing protein n=1 Tax=Chlorella ohadii TaxID=2649997 RepID=A0AAD5DUD4_9CHLO|nr:hypothetical protein COHA_003127 [Chlorella ohadii]
MCMHGRFCGRECSGVVDGQPDKPKAPPMDELDRACFFHDKCLTKENRGTCAGCHCNAQLDAVANKIWKEGSAAERCGCNLFDKTCSDYTKDAYYVHLYATFYETSTNCGRPEDCPDAPVGDQCRASLMYETDLNGGTLQDVSVNDWAECCDVCSSDPDCRAWTYSIGICSLKDSSGWTAEAREGYMSGLSLSTPL